MFRQKKGFSRKERRKFKRERIKEDGRHLAEWLNDAPESNGDKTRIFTVLGLLRQLEATRQGLPSEPRDRPEQIEKLRILEARLRDQTSHYVTRPNFWLDMNYSTIRFGHLFNYAEGRTEREEAHALGTIEELVTEGLLLSRLKTCQVCARWVFHLKSGGKYCDSKKCRNAFYEAKQERKERKKNISHKNYHAAKQREKRNLERVKQGGTLDDKAQTAERVRISRGRVLVSPLLR